MLRVRIFEGDQIVDVDVDERFMVVCDKTRLNFYC